jgi:hypothetical protein
MTLNDESLLTAYLDGELEPDQKLSVESALLADPELARRVRRLAAVRELVAGLPRPQLAVDLAETIVGRIGADSVSPSRRLWNRLSARPWAIAAGASAFMALAASLVLAVSLSLHRPPAAGPRSPVASVLALPAPARALARAETPRGSRPVGSSEPAGSVRASDPWFTGDRPRRNDDPAVGAQIRAMLDSPHLRRVLIVTDVIGGGTLDRVEELVQQTPRTEATYGRITVSQGIVIDPLHPKEATVFALVMNEQERRNFKKKLEQAFPERVEDAEADPVVVTQLAEVGQMTMLPGTRASEVIIPGDVSPRIALRSDPGGQQPVLNTSQLEPDFGLPDLASAAAVDKRGGEGGSRPGDDARPESPSNAQVSARGAESSRDRPGAPGAHPANPLAESLSRAVGLHEPPEIVLVWVTPA